MNINFPLWHKFINSGGIILPTDIEVFPKRGSPKSSIPPQNAFI